MTTVIGLVTEGPNDRTVISAVTDHIAQTLAPERQIIYRQIQPPPTGTSGGGESGGWTEVYRWCLRNPPDVRENLIFGPSLTGEPACDVLVVQLDGDSVDEYELHGPPAPSPPLSAKSRKAYV